MPCARLRAECEGKASPPLPSMLQVTSHSVTPPLCDPGAGNVVACAMPEGCVRSRRPLSAGNVTQRACLECICGGASRALSRNGTPGRAVLATGLDGMLNVDLATLAELAVGYQRGLRAASMETWLSRVQETAPLHERLLGSL